ncbi:hypothetical protein CYY_005203 [Polysphondylium violaceum]|uniref:NAD-dependent epimerase/dehydratase domain-containing protein n=1 Tax=Polysphondylium violaceum TaxID=133409 RepID=A0A8J4PWZ9_9MYCE|nr:hypothetical protein CYY_005203 [Polysphondylium violaceum]
MIDNSNDNQQSPCVLLFGGTGWIGNKMIDLMKEKSIKYYVSTNRLENRSEIIEEIKRVNPTSILNCAGITGRPNIDWCEDHKVETIRSNIIGTLNLLDIANQCNVHVCNLATGCIYQYDDKHPINSGIGFKEEEAYNYFGSFYSTAKQTVEQLSKNYPNTLTLRLRMPISDSVQEPRNFITKIKNYERVVNVPNSMSVLYDLLPVMLDMCCKQTVGVFNFVNPGVISHNEILDLYKLHIDPSFQYQNFSVEEQDRILKAGRSNNHLDTSKLESLYPNIPHIQTSIQDVFKRMKRNTSTPTTTN